MVIFHLQYVDDKLCIGEALADNLWTLKVILHGFKMTLELKDIYMQGKITKGVIGFLTDDHTCLGSRSLRTRSRKWRNI